jgi:hypothetical protein
MLQELHMSLKPSLRYVSDASEIFQLELIDLQYFWTCDSSFNQEALFTFYVSWQYLGSLCYLS